MKSRHRMLVATPVSGVLLYLTFRGLEPAALLRSVGDVHVVYVALYLVALLLTQVARAARWGLLVAPFAPLEPAQVWRISNIGNMLIMLLPLRLGELSRPYLTSKATGCRLSEGAGAAVLERVLDGLLVTLLFFLTTWILQSEVAMPRPLMAGAQIALAVFVTASVGLALALRFEQGMARLIERLIVPRAPGLGRKASSTLKGFVAGLRALPSRQVVLGVCGWTFFYWSINALGMAALIAAFDWQLPPLAGATVVCVLVVGVMVPAGPGLLGTYQAAILAALSAFGIGKTEAAAYSLVAYLGNLLVVVGCGLPHLWGHTLDGVEEILHSAEGEAQPERLTQ